MFDAWKSSQDILPNAGLMVIYHCAKYKITLNLATLEQPRVSIPEKHNANCWV